MCVFCPSGSSRLPGERVLAWVTLPLTRRLFLQASGGAAAAQRRCRSGGEFARLTFTPLNPSDVQLRLTCNRLQVVQVMVGLLSLGLGPRQTFAFPADSTGVGAAFWLGAVVNDRVIKHKTTFPPACRYLDRNDPSDVSESEIDQFYPKQAPFVHFCPGSTSLLVSWLWVLACLCLWAWYVSAAGPCKFCCGFAIRTGFSSPQMAAAVSVNLVGATAAGCWCCAVCRGPGHRFRCVDVSRLQG